MLKPPLKEKEVFILNKKSSECFNVIYEDNNITIPEIDNMDLLTFGMTFMKIRARELNNNNTYSVKQHSI